MTAAPAAAPCLFVAPSLLASAPALVAAALLLVATAAPASGYPEKRAPFSSWAGKRSDPAVDMDLRRLLHDLQELYTLQQEQAEQDEEDLDEEAIVKRAPFSSWAGKSPCCFKAAA